jgi:CcmD family protein
MTRLLRLLALCLTLAGFGLASAQPAAPPDGDGFEKVDGSMVKGESMPASTLVAAAYGFIFAAVAVYVLSVVSRTRRLEEELDHLRSRLAGKK